MQRNKIGLASVLLAILVTTLAVRLTIAASDNASKYTWTEPVVEVLSEVEKRFYKDTDLDALQVAAIRGMLEELDDPYTEYIPKVDVADFNKDIRGEYVGIGAAVRPESGWVMIVSPLEDSPAYKSGVEAEDLVVAVNGKSIWQRDIDDVIDELMGEPGTVVMLTIERKGDASDLPRGAQAATITDAVQTDNGEAPGPMTGSVRFDLPITRDRIITSTVKGIHREGDSWNYMIDPVDKIGYIRVTQFTGGTVPELFNACRSLLNDGMKGLILDLRFNGGGSLAAAIDMADLFLREGVIVETRGRSGPPQRAWARPENTLPDFPMVVVVNGASASASEVVSGALSDNGRAQILGERTFGKGIVQGLYNLPSGSGQLKITEQYYYLPSGRCIQREDDSTEWGVDPDPGFYVPMTDEQVTNMLRLRRDEDIIRADQTEACCWDDPAWIRDHLGDPQLSAAMDAISARLITGEWAPVGGDTPPGTLDLAALKTAERTRELLVRELVRNGKRIEALEKATRGMTPLEPFDLIPDDKPLEGGHIDIRDAEGNIIATLKITGNDLERWLVDAPVAKETADGSE
ncbi:MAG: S41 family peptidase [Phycisphaeraceae bacterium]|nr:S41 family peptidase [Phycisphaerales bacterium]MCB9844334.1 S41 family peptidase [Phycisphaeraceae bacterium]